MSLVTNYILTWAGLPTQLLQHVNAELAKLEPDAPQLFVSVDEHAGGRKHMEHRVALLAGNYLPHEQVWAAIEHASKSTDVFTRESIRLFVCGDNDDAFEELIPGVAVGDGHRHIRRIGQHFTGKTGRTLEELQSKLTTEQAAELVVGGVPHELTKICPVCNGEPLRKGCKLCINGRVA